MVRSGVVNIYAILATTPALRSGNAIGWEWTRIAVAWGSASYAQDTPATAQYLQFSTTTTITSYTVVATGAYQRFHGFTLRCLSTAVEGEESGEIVFVAMITLSFCQKCDIL